MHSSPSKRAPGVLQERSSPSDSTLGSSTAHTNTPFLLHPSFAATPTLDLHNEEAEPYLINNLIDGAPRVPNNSPASSIGDPGSELSTPDNLSLISLSLNDRSPRVFVIAISGPSSSGKTTLTAILTEVFSVAAAKEDGEVDMETAIIFDKAGNVKQDNKDEILAAKKMALARPVICLHQDCYFVHDKGLCPFGVFYSHENDYTFIMKTRQGDNFGSIPEPGGRLRPKLIDIYPPSRARSLDYLIFEGGQALRKKVTGPDTDCDKAIRFSAMADDLKKIIHGGNPEYPVVKGSGKERNSHFEAENQASMSEKAIRQYADLIQEMKDRVVSVVQDNERDTTFCIVDGFLLFTDPAKKDDAFDIIEAEAKEKTARACIARLEELTFELEKEEDAACPELEKERDENETKLFEIGAQAKVAMQNLFDLKLFLPASKDEVKKRRFARAEYIDFPSGLRLPGQMWKTEGYFDEKVWSNYVKAHDWLIDEDGKAKGVDGFQVRPIVDAGIGFTVRWAVDSILAKLGYATPDPQKRICCGEGCCDRGDSSVDL